MKKLNLQLILSLVVFIFSSVFAQNEKNIVDEIQVLKDKIRSLEKEKAIQSNQIKQIELKLKTLKDSVNYKLNLNAKELKTVDEKLTLKIDINDSTATKKYSDLDKSVSNKTIYWIIGFLILAGVLTVAYHILKKKIYTEKNNIGEQIRKTRKELEEEGIKLDNKLMEIMNSQLKILNIDKSKETEEKDHSLAIKVADEIIRIQMNLAYMDPNIKGVSNLKNRVSAILDNFLANGYEIIDLLNKPYDQGMNIVATLEADERLARGEQIIKRIIKPQINFKGKMIQAAQVVVGYGE